MGNYGGKHIGVHISFFKDILNLTENVLKKGNQEQGNEKNQE